METTSENGRATYYVAANGYNHYFTFDAERNTATLHSGEKVTITQERLTDFLHTAKMLGMGVGKDGTAL